MARFWLPQMPLQAIPTFGVASSVCHSERSSLLKAAPLPLPSGSLAAQATAQTAQHKRICDRVARFWLLQMRLQAIPTFGVASSVCHSERSSLLKAAPLPLPSRSLAAHF
ncbi:MAG: hypothetical protein WCS19_06060, partial [Candidatus Cloacimonadaceae bacterium]